MANQTVKPINLFCSVLASLPGIKAHLFKYRALLTTSALQGALPSLIESFTRDTAGRCKKPALVSDSA